MINKNYTNIRSIATMATLPVYDELVLLLRSIALFHPDIPIFISAQSIVKKRLEQENGLPTNITITLGLEKYGNKSWKLLSAPEAIEFLSQKSIIIEQALKHHPNSLFVDSDITMASPLGLVDDSKDLGLALTVPERITSFGKYNAGWIFVNNKKFPHWWRNAMAKGSSPFIEQICLNDVTKHFNIFHFLPNYNFSPDGQLSYFAVESKKWFHRLLRINSDTNKGITYKDRSIVSFHYRYYRTYFPSWHYFIMMHLYRGSPELFKLINSSTNHPLSGKSLVRNETFILALQVNKRITSTIIRNVSFLYLDYTKFLRISRKGYYYKLVRGIVAIILYPYYLIATIILYPYYLISEGIYFYHAINRLTKRKLSKQKLSKILALSCCQPRRLLYFYRLGFWRKKKFRFS